MAAIELHSSLGPANTTVSMIAERAGVQRHTFYSHFPDERSMLMACSGHCLEQDPPPDAAPWRAIADPAERLGVGLSAVYGWYERNADLLGCVLRDAEHHRLVREIVDLRYGPRIASFHDALGEGCSAGQRAMLALALSYYTWRTLRRAAALTRADAVAAMVQAVSGLEVATASKRCDDRIS